MVNNVELKNKLQNCLQIGDNDLIGSKFNGHDLHLYLQEKGIDAKHFVRNKDSDDVNTFLMHPVANSKEYMSNLLYSEPFLEADLLHLHLIHNTPFDMSYLPIISKMKPVIWTLHDPWALGAHCIHHFECEKWQTHCSECQHLDVPFQISKDNVRLEFERKKEAIQNSQIVAIVASTWMKNKVEKSPIWKDKKVYLIPFGINQSLYKPKEIIQAKKELNIPPENFVLFFREDSGLFKGLDVIKELLNKLKNEKNITILTVHTKGHLENYKEFFDIREFGWVSDEKEMVKLYQACDIFLMPSKQETFGMMAIEAMSCGKMVLAIESDGSALPEVINSPFCGLSPSVENYVEKFLRLYNNREELQARSAASYDWALKNYSSEIYVKRMIDVYQDVLNNFEHTEEGLALLNDIAKNKIEKEKFLPIPAPPVSENVLEEEKACIELQAVRSQNTKKLTKHRFKKLAYQLLIRPFLIMLFGKEKVKRNCDEVIRTNYKES